MSVVDDIVQAVAGSTKLDATTKSIVTEFLQAAGPALETLAPAAVQDVMASVAAGDSAAAIGPLADAFTPEQVVSALGATQQEMNAEVDLRSRQVAAARTAVGAIESAAASVLARLLLSAL